MTVAIDVRDDPDHPEGGNALILFRGVADPGGAATLMIDPLTEGFDYQGPRRIEVAGRVTLDGFEVAVGPDVVSALPPGIATSLGLAGSGLAADVRWPILAQKAAESRRRVVQPQTRRVVVAGAGGVARSAPPRPKLQQQPKTTGESPAFGDSSATTGGESKPDAEPKPDAKRGETPTAKVTVGDAARGESEPAGDTVTPKPDETLLDRKMAPIPGRRSAPAGWRTGSVAAAMILAFLAGAGGMGAAWFSRPKPVAEHVAMAALPSPYDMLNELSDRSPAGARVDQRDARAFRLRGDKAGSPKETDFWHDWATKSLLTGKTNDAAATLSDFATDLARGHGTGAVGDAPALAAARFLWEMAALASDCAAMDNIAAALSRDGQTGTDQEAGVWHDRAALCRSATKTAR